MNVFIDKAGDIDEELPMKQRSAKLKKRSHTLQFIPQVFIQTIAVCVSGKIERIVLYWWKLGLHNFSTVGYLSVKDFITSAVFTNAFLINYKL